jgi:hypothetical protein
MTTTSSNLVMRLQRWKDDRGALANLRCALRPKLRSRAWPLLAQVSSLEAPSLVIYETVAGLWATDPGSHRAGAGDFGVTCRKLRGDHESFDLRFYAADGRDRVRVRWAQAYWGTVAEENVSEPATATTSTP